MVKIAIVEESAPEDRATRLCPLLFALTTFDATTTPEIREELISGLLVIAHHPRLGESTIWIDLLQRAGLAPETMVTARWTQLLSFLFFDASTTPTVRSSSSVSLLAMTDTLRSNRAVNLPKLLIALLRLWHSLLQRWQCRDCLLKSKTIFRCNDWRSLVRLSTVSGQRLTARHS